MALHIISCLVGWKTNKTYDSSRVIPSCTPFLSKEFFQPSKPRVRNNTLPLWIFLRIPISNFQRLLLTRSRNQPANSQGQIYTQQPTETSPTTCDLGTCSHHTVIADAARTHAPGTWEIVARCVCFWGGRLFFWFFSLRCRECMEDLRCMEYIYL